MVSVVIARHDASPRRRRPWHAQKPFVREPGRSLLLSPPVVAGTASGRPEAVADDERDGEVGPAHDFITIVAGSLLPVFLSLLIVVPGEPAWSQSGKSIRIIVPFPPGGSADVLARILGNQISEANGQTVIVDNRPGAGASIAYELAARAAPDGNTLVIASNLSSSIPF